VQYRLPRAVETLDADGRLELRRHRRAARLAGPADVINGLKAARKFPDELDGIARTTGGGRLAELAALYAAYQDRLIRRMGQTASASAGWRSKPNKRAPEVGRLGSVGRRRLRGFTTCRSRCWRSDRASTGCSSRSAR
jgi:hypothetical protein